MNYILFDEVTARENLLPFTFTRPVCGIRFGILTILEKWELYLDGPVSHHTQGYLQQKYSMAAGDDSIYINGKICPNAELVNLITALKPGTRLVRDNDLVAYRSSENVEFTEEAALKNMIFTAQDYLSINYPWEIFLKAGEAIRQDFERLTRGRTSQPLSHTNTLIGDPAMLFIEEGAMVESSTLNTTSGPVYIGRDAEVMEQCAVRGPFALGEHSALKLSAKVYGPTSIGPHCKVGGEINNSVIFGYSNKAHDGFLGNSVLGEWCNLGADTNNSNLKNNYGSVKLYNYATGKQEDTGLQFCGLMMGDHSKCGINTMFNTGTVVGVGANIFGGGFPPTHIPSFSWGGSEGFEEYRLDKMFETTARVFARRSLPLADTDKKILSEVFEQTKSSRKS